jgi:UDP-N-acetylglucosamine 4,6-dehydratase
MRQEINLYIQRHYLTRSILDKGVDISYLIGDIRDRKRIELATKDVDIIIHCAALKQVPSCEDNPLEAINTNIIGAQNVLYAALENKVKKVMGISTDKAVLPINLYGATKMCVEKLFIQGNTYSGGRHPLFSCCRYGNVLGSRGSVVPLFKKQYKESGKVTITDLAMSRFWITLPRVANFILQSIEEMTGGEIFIPKMGSAVITTILEAVIPEQCKIENCGIRPGEKLHEILITKEESENTYEYKNRFVIRKEKINTDPMPSFEYRSDTNENQLTYQQIRRMIKDN